MRGAAWCSEHERAIIPLMVVELPAELLPHVLSYLDTSSSIATFASTCVTWRDAVDASDEDLWRRVSRALRLGRGFAQLSHNHAAPLRHQLAAYVSLQECNTNGEHRKPTPYYTFAPWQTDIEDKPDDELCKLEQYGRLWGTPRPTAAEIAEHRGQYRALGFKQLASPSSGAGPSSPERLTRIWHSQ